MGKKAKFTDEELPKKGKGRKNNRKKNPEEPFKIDKKVFQQDDDEQKKMSHHQKQREARRQAKKEEWKEKRKQIKENRKKKYQPQEEPPIPNQKKKKLTLSGASVEMKKKILSKVRGKNSKCLKVPEEKENDQMDVSNDFPSDDENNESNGEENYAVDKPRDVNNGEGTDDELKNEKKDSEHIQMNIASQDVFAFASDGDINALASIPEVKTRIKDTLLVLSNFKKFRETNRNRQEYLTLLKRDLCTYFSYNEFLMECIMNLFPLDELMSFLEASETQRPVTIRTNSLQIGRRDLAQALISREVNIDPVGKWSNIGLVVNSSPEPIGATLEYLAGFYMLQAASSLLPVIALAPRENERILDLCAAPGGKASHIAALMKNTGVLYANDVNKARVKGIVSNFHRLGITNSIITSYDGRSYPQVMKGFDRVLVDAPCTGTGVIANNPSVKMSNIEADLQKCSTLQRELLLAAIDCLNASSSAGGYLVYSTCSILVEENEDVINYALKNRDVKLVSTGLDFGTEGFVNHRQYRFHPSLNLTRRFYPHKHNLDGFFIAKFKKYSDVVTS